MSVLILSQNGTIAGDSWTYVSMALALMSALSAFFYGYALAVTAEDRAAPAVAPLSPPSELVPAPRPAAVAAHREAA